MLDKKPDHFDGLVAEWIGEVGQLHQKIQQLPKAMDEALLPTMRLLNDLSKQLNSLHSTNDELLRKTMGNRVEVESYSMQSIHLPSNPISSLQTVLIAGLSFGFGFGAQAIHLSAIGAATVGIIVGVLVSQATLFFQKNQENRLKLVKPKENSTA